MQEVPVLKGEAEPAKLDSSGLLAKASPETSAMTLFIYDRNTLCAFTICLTAKRREEILDDLSSVKAEPAEDWSAKDASSCLRNEIGPGGWTEPVSAWTNGRWIAQDGSVYQFDYDFEALKQREGVGECRRTALFTNFPCARVLHRKRTVEYPVPGSGSSFKSSQGNYHDAGFLGQ